MISRHIFSILNRRVRILRNVEGNDIGSLRVKLTLETIYGAGLEFVDSIKLTPVGLVIDFPEEEGVSKYIGANDDDDDNDNNRKDRDDRQRAVEREDDSRAFRRFRGDWVGV